VCLESCIGQEQILWSVQMRNKKMSVILLSFSWRPEQIVYSRCRTMSKASRESYLGIIWHWVDWRVPVTLIISGEASFLSIKKGIYWKIAAAASDVESFQKQSSRPVWPDWAKFRHLGYFLGVGRIFFKNIAQNSPK
jgi:hypothetical protein